MTPFQRRGWGLGAALLGSTGLLTLPATAADPAASNGVYGRFDGDLDIGVGLGAELEADRIRGAARLSLHYYSMIGAYASYRDALGGEGAGRQVLSAGIDLRPAFIPRWAANLEQGPSFLDLAIDSISLGIGASWEQPQDGAFGERLGLQASLGFGLPLFGTAQGLWLEPRGTLRWLEAAGTDSNATVPSLLLTLAWHELVLTPLAAEQDG